MFTDHRNLIYIFDLGTEVKKHKATALGLKPNEYEYEIENFPGDENVLADMFSRWAGEKPAVARTTTMKRWETEKLSQVRPLTSLE
ncbi:LOW QUALITY PROTEIN: hypothetical protein PHMEG_0006385 [Phytophthora megakarya]|uniref:Reverse transcriptase RNase H-like domain-containing protein n=1 Tax=Phytophthora megakarya TaxID=4795 RepID=A0A225WR15_9STRA|nr:LOW QUALITY PROTEIN: hypothetical protein PHMEG_0006385 [Phytophthora megakarya]